MSALGTWPVMQTSGTESIIAVAMPVTRLVAPGPEVASTTPTRAARAGVAVGHVRGALLVPHEHVVNRVVEHRVVGRQDGAAGIAEDRLHALAYEAFPENLRAGTLHRGDCRAADTDKSN